jgi:hypothetical protein
MCVPLRQRLTLQYIQVSRVAGQAHLVLSESWMNHLDSHLCPENFTEGAYQSDRKREFSEVISSIQNTQVLSSPA